MEVGELEEKEVSETVEEPAARHARVMTEEHELEYRALLEASETLPPTANEVVDAILELRCEDMPVFIEMPTWVTLLLVVYPSTPSPAPSIVGEHVPNNCKVTLLGPAIGWWQRAHLWLDDSIVWSSFAWPRGVCPGQAGNAFAAPNLESCGHKRCKHMVSALPMMVYYSDAPPRHLCPGKHGVECAHLTGAQGKGSGVVHKQDCLLNPVEDDNWGYAMCIIWGASPCSV
ncbi:uncharacterized protein UHOR_14671 [Ustilago hordei]|uniref:Uncharacterized protein n=1 Tax=Ustilago hordei TaxID=120017 RepID=I2FVD9_USTHO|nr:uncharacterized protein UHOR_14671 [Ustilago hordei]